MKKVLGIVMGMTVAIGWGGDAHAYTSKGKGTTSVSASGVTESTAFSISVVVQGTADTAGTIGFGSGANTFRDSGEAIKVNVDTNAAGNRVIVYTDNLNAAANPKACLDTATGIDGGGLVGVGDCARTVPVVWGAADTNVDYAFTARPLPDIGSSNAIFVTDLAHVATFTAANSALDNLAMKFCGGANVANTSGDGLYPQFFGGPGQDKDLCRRSDSTKVVEAEELSKNIAVAAFGFAGAAGRLTNTTTLSGNVPVTSPFYLSLAADFRQAPAQDYSTSTLTVELVTQ